MTNTGYPERIEVAAPFWLVVLVLVGVVFVIMCIGFLAITLYRRWKLN